MRNRIEVNDVPVTEDYRSLSAGEMYRLPAGGTCIYMKMPNGGSVNLSSGETYNHSRGGCKQIVRLAPGTEVTIVAGGDDCRMAS